MADQFMVAYAKIIVDKNEISLNGVFFGGISDSQAEADTIARDCVNTIRGGTILPRVIPLPDNAQLLDALYDVTEIFERLTANMIEANEIINRKRRKT